MPQKPIRLPTLKSLQVKNPNPKAENPCLQIMSGMLSKSKLPCFVISVALRRPRQIRDKFLSL